MAYTTIKKPSDYFNTKLYTGNGTNNTSITGVGFQPDLLWIKDRTNVNNHSLQDAVRGAGYNLQTNTTNAQGLATETISSFDTDGWTMNNGGGVNGSGASFVAWNWLAANGTASNTDGSITSTVSVNTTAGFSIVKFTGTGANATVGHGLGAVPKFIFGKNVNLGTSAWPVYSSVLGGTKYLNINTSSGEGTFGGYWNNTNPTSSVISIGSHGDVNGSGNNIIFYCFADVTGYSKSGSYTGNGNADGSFVYTGFKPAMVLYKNSSSTADWLIYDTKRIHSGTQLDYLEPNTSDADGFLAIDVLSNGFKLREASGAKFNASGDTYVYMAFAEEPLVGDNPATAR